MEQIARLLQGRHLAAAHLALVRAARSVRAHIKLRLVVAVVCPMLVLLAAGVILLNLKHITIVDAGKSSKVTTFDSDPAEILSQNGIKTSPYDKVTFSGIDKGNGTITVVPAFAVGVSADKKNSRVMIAEGTVADVLKKADVTPGPEDIVSAPLSSAVKPGETVTVRRVTYATKTNFKPLSYATETVPSAMYKKGVQLVLDEGREGRQAITTKVKLIDGQPTSSTTVSESVSLAPLSRRLLVGTASSAPLSPLAAPSSLKLDAEGVPTHYSEVFSGPATAYYARKGALTDSGRRAGVGYVAVNPRLIPYGSKLYIMSPDGSFVYGYAIAADTGAFVHDGSGVLTDLYFPSKSACDRFGVHDVNIYVLN